MREPDGLSEEFYLKQEETCIHIYIHPLNPLHKHHSLSTHTHQAASGQTQVVGAGVDAGGAIPHTLSLAHVETIPSRPAGQLTLLLQPHCPTEREREVTHTHSHHLSFKRMTSPVFISALLHVCVCVCVCVRTLSSVDCVCVRGSVCA